MLRIHVRLDLENEARKTGLVRVKWPSRGRARARRRCQVDEVIEQWFQPAVGHGAAEKYGRDLTGEETLAVKGRARRLQQGHLVAQALQLALTQNLQQLAVVPVRLAHLAAMAAAGSVEDLQRLRPAIEKSHK